MDDRTALDGLKPMNKTLPILLARARETLLSYWRPKLTEMGFTEQQWRVLRVVAEHKRIDISTLSEETAMHMPSVTRILQTLEQNGLVERTRDEEDSRRSWVRATQKTFDVLASCVETSNEIYAGIEKKFDNKKMAQLLTLLREFSDVRTGS
nr:homoprotocatechuate degradation operon regulator HpaR [Amylibacter sp.]